MNYANGNKASLPLINADVRNNPGIFPTPEAMSKLFVTEADTAPLLLMRNQSIRSERITYHFLL
jgi:putrescine transport system substrate-binding protein